MAILQTHQIQGAVIAAHNFSKIPTWISFEYHSRAFDIDFT
jgi:hypothetical protein